MKPKFHNVLCRALMPTIVTSLALSSFTASGADVSKSTAANTIALNVASAWNGGAIPGSGDVAVWDNTVSATNLDTSVTLAPVGGNLSVSGIRIANVGGTANQTGLNSGIQLRNASSANTITIGAGGIDMSAATQAVILQSKISLTENQTWSIANANTNANPFLGNGINSTTNEDLLFFGLLEGAAFNLGGKTLTVSGAGNLAIAAGYLISNGTINLSVPQTWIQSGGNRTLNIASNASINVSTSALLRLRTNSGAAGVGVNSAAPIALAGVGSVLQIEQNNATNTSTQSGLITMNAGSTLTTIHSQAGPVTISGGLAILGNATLSVTGGNAHAGGIAVTGNLTGSGNLTYLNANTAANNNGQVRLSGNNAAYSGAISLNGGSGNRALRLSSATSGSALATWNVSANNTLQLDGVAVQLGTLNGAGSVTNVHATNAATATIGAGVFSGIISNGAASTALVKNTAGVLTLSGACSYTGTTDVLAGKLFTTSQQVNASTVNVADGATFGVNQLAASDQFVATTLQAGATTGAQLELGIGTGGNPTVAPIKVTTLNLNAPTVLKVSGITLSPGVFPAIAYTTLAGASSVSAMTLQLPPRTVGTIVDNVANSTIDVSITTVESIKWSGSLSQDWDIDPSGAGAAGSLNWTTTVSSASSRYLQGSGGTDSVLFDDSAAGTGPVTVNLSTALTPVAVLVNNATRDYIFTGSGALSGSCGISKDGAASLTLANTSANTYSGLTDIALGSLILGDGVTAGAGMISGAIRNDGSLVLNRPDDFTFANAYSGTGEFVKQQSNTVTFGASIAINGGVAINGGALTFAAGGTLSGSLSGSGSLNLTGGTLTINGTGPHSFTGTTSVSAGIMNLSSGTGPVLGNVVNVSGAAQLVVLANEQISDTATITFSGTSGDPMVGSTGTETVTNVILNTSNGTTGQFVMKNTFSILGTATVNSGIFGIGSGGTANINAIVVDAPIPANAIVRIAGNGAASTMNIGSGGLVANGGAMQIKFNTTDQNAIVNLGGNVTLNGDFTISNGGYTGASWNVINLTGTRTFTIGSGTTTTCAADFADDATLTADLEDAFTGNLIKAGAGKLVLGPLCNVGHSGTTVVNEGTLIVNGTMPIQAPTLAAGTTLGGNGTITAATTIPTGATISPGDGTAATLNFVSDVTLAAGSTYAVDITSAVAVDKISAPAANLSVAGTIAVKLTGYAPVANDVFDIADATAITGTPTFDFSQAVLSAGLAWDTSGFATTGQIKVIVQGYAAFAEAITNPAHRAADFDADGDGVANVLEYVLAGSPTAHDVAILPDVSVSSTALVFTFSRSDNSENDTTQVVQFSTNLVDWTDVPITPTGTLPAGVTVDVVESGSAADTITVTIPKLTDAAKYARLKVTTP